MGNYDTIKKSSAFKMSDIIIILGAAILLICAVFLIKPTGRGEFAYIYSGSKLIKIMPLADDDVFLYEFDGHYNQITVKDGAISVTAADCDDELCLNSLPINVSGSSIICLPHKLYIEVQGGGGDNGVDDYVFFKSGGGI